MSVQGRCRYNLELGDRERGEGRMVMCRSCDWSKFNISESTYSPFLPHHLHHGTEKKNPDCTCPWEVVPACRSRADNRQKPVHNFVKSFPHSKVFMLSSSQGGTYVSISEVHDSPSYEGLSRIIKV